ncbi:MAG: peptide chain release factor N(5)-glutamine methyltransferase [Elusimicrobia bacterium]|nr:peptide chain release factor N(5)-glutamine methyltransferase [Elusimicrobiota bacterium]
MITIKQLVDGAKARFEAKGVDEALAHAELIAAFAFNKSRTYIRAFGQNVVYEKEEKLFNKIVEEKLSGKPLAHIIGEAEFMGRLFSVGPTVLIPRPETEELVEETIKNLPLKQPSRILDLCSGSGCIAISLAFTFPSAEIIGADISPEALQVARKNAENMNLGKKVNFVQSDIFENIDGEFDFIISNPPYIPTDVIATLSPEVRNEPRLALDGGSDGLDVIRKIISSAPAHLADGGLLSLEIGCAQSEKVLKFFNEEEWEVPFSRKDFAGIERFIFARKKSAPKN